MIAGQLALLIASVFAGAAIYVSTVEHVAREALDDRAALIEWRPAYKRGYAMQASLAAAGFLLGVLAWWQTGYWIWLLGAVFLILPWPFTLLVIMPTNTRLLATDPANAGPQSRALLQKWGRLHGVRTALGCLATASFLIASLR